MKKLITIICLSVAFGAAGQSTGSIVGLLTDKEFNNEPLAFVNLFIEEEKKGTTSDFDGLYALEDLSEGTYTVVYSFVGYETVEIADISVEAGKVTTVNVPMCASAANLSSGVSAAVKDIKISGINRFNMARARSLRVAEMRPAIQPDNVSAMIFGRSKP